MRYIKQYGVRALLINHLPAEYGDNPQFHFVAKYQVAMLEPEGLLITRDPFSSRMEILPDQVSIRSMEHGVIASQLIRAEQKFGQLGPTISGNVTALPSGVLKDTIGLIYGSLPQHYEFNSAMAAMSRLGYTTFDMAGLHDGQHLTGLWFFDCQ